MKGTSMLRAVICAVGLFLAGAMPVHAEIASGQAFQGSEWKLIAETEIKGSNGLVQSICCTKDYIICLENYNDLTTEPDVISAYYRNTTDANGNPVEQYSLAKQVQETDYGHANGMAYNPTTNEIVVSEYSSQVEEDYGCVYLIDATTLEYKGKRKVSDSWTLLGIDYLPEKDAYLIQTNADGGFRFLLLSNDFEILEDWGSYPGAMTGRNFQDLCASGDYFINFPLTKNSGMGDFVEVYSISEKERVDSVPVDFHFGSEIVNNEPEGVCETEPGVFVVVNNVYYANGKHTARLYETTVPYLYTVSVEAEHTMVSQDTTKCYRGDSCTISYEAEEGYQLESVRIDGVYLDLEEYPSEYTFQEISSNHEIALCSVNPTVSATIEEPKILMAENVSAPSVQVSTVTSSIPESQAGSIVRTELVKGTWIRNLGLYLSLPVVFLLLFFFSYLKFSRYQERAKSRKNLQMSRERYRKLMEEDDTKDREIWEKYSGYDEIFGQK